jgi:cytoskeletal protein CcmA (bactofilin family)
MDVAGAIQGKIDILGKLRVSGHVAGDSRAAQVHADGAVIHGGIDSRDSVEIGAGSVVVGGITAKSAVIAGAVKGDIDVEGPRVLGPSAVVLGNIRCRLLRIQDGAVLEGRCSTDYAQVSPASFFEGYGPGMAHGQGNGFFQPPPAAG